MFAFEHHPLQFLDLGSQDFVELVSRCLVLKGVIDGQLRLPNMIHSHNSHCTHSLTSKATSGAIIMNLVGLVYMDL